MKFKSNDNLLIELAHYDAGSSELPSMVECLRQVENHSLHLLMMITYMYVIQFNHDAVRSRALPPENLTNTRGDTLEINYYCVIWKMGKLKIILSNRIFPPYITDCDWHKNNTHCIVIIGNQHKGLF